MNVLYQNKNSAVLSTRTVFENCLTSAKFDERMRIYQKQFKIDVAKLTKFKVYIYKEHSKCST